MKPQDFALYLNNHALIVIVIFVACRDLTISAFPIFPVNDLDIIRAFSGARILKRVAVCAD